MKLKSYILLFILSLSSWAFYAQKGDVKGYRIEDDEIVFTFDKRDYEKITDEKNQKRMDFEDFDIKNVAVSGEFNLWSRDSWTMKKVNENIYELRKKVSDFNDNFEWQFKFVINNNFWAEPSEDVANIAPAVKENGQRLDTYNLMFMNAFVSEKGNAKFQLNGFSKASKVILAGSFNKWNESLFEMKKTDTGWELTLQLRPEIYQYKFIVDGQWITDPDNSNKERNEFEGYNSVIEIQTDVQFVLYNYPNAKEVILAGDFNNWSEDKCKMMKSEKGWIATISLTGGKYHYKFIVDGQWITDPYNKVREYDEKGHINSVRMVR